MNCFASFIRLSARTKNGEYYRKKSMLTIRYGIMKHFETSYNIDVINSPDFKECNKIFNAVLMKIKREGNYC